MEVKPGYKQTDVGVIPEDWQVSAIEPLVDEISMGPFGSDITVSNFVSSGIPVLNGSNVAQERLHDSFENFVTAEKARGLKKAVARRGDVVVTHRGTIGQVAYIPEDSIFEKYIVSQSQFRVRFSRKVLPSWVVSYFHSESGSKKLLEGKGHTGVPAIAQPTRTFRSLLLPVPPLLEQRAIATALSDMDTLLDGLNRLIAKKRAIKQATMQQLLTGQARLPGFSGEWEVKRLGDLADIRSGGTPSTGDAAAWDGTIPWCTPTDITALEGRKYLTTTNRAITEHGLSTSSAELIPARSVVMTSRATIGECAINAVPVTTNQGFKNLVLHDSVDVEFLYYLISTQKQGLIGLSAGSTFLEVGKTQLRKYGVKLPAEKEEQTAIATVLTDMDAEITALETRRTKTRALKQAMMQELLTGRTRLVEHSLGSSGKVVNIPAEKAKEKTKAHNWQINEAVVISILADRFGSAQYPLGRKRCTKLTYLLHRHVEHVAQGFRKKAAGPYNPDVKYKGPEGIAQKNGYIRSHTNGNFSGFVSSGNIAEAEAYFMDWYGQDVLDWLEQFRKKTNDELELLTTVDMSAVDLKQKGSSINLENVKSLIATHPEWKAKLEREIFSDFNIHRAIRSVNELFAEQG